jgi:mannose/cellobiose epimerase-like protein (N-acyl-D-glucosamine 2-epimerase family)
VWSDGACRSAAQRLWPQTERLKAELLRADADDARAAASARAMAAYLRPDGTWHERRGADGALSGEAAPASSLYHLTGAILTAADALGLRAGEAARSA